LRYRIAALALVAMLLPALGLAEDKLPAPPEGTWKVFLPRNDPFWLVRFEKKGEAWTGQVVADAPRAPKGKLSGLKVTKDLVSFTIKAEQPEVPGAPPGLSQALVIQFQMKLGGKPDKMLGSMQLNRRTFPALMERTSIKTLDSYDVDLDALAHE